MTDAVRTEVRASVYEITLDRPPANAIDLQTSRDLHRAFAHFRDDGAAHVAIITGAGERFFSAGWDLKAAAAGDETPLTEFGPGGFAGLTELFDLDKPVIAALNGLAAGGGFELALAADLIVAAEHCELFLPEVNIGIIPDAGGVLRLPRRLPHAVAMEMLLTGRRMGAGEALERGLVNAVTSTGDLMLTARSLAERVAAAAPLATRAVKAVVRETAHLPLPAAFASMRADVPAYRAVLGSDDALEGPAAFAARRPPVWQGR